MATKQPATERFTEAVAPLGLRPEIIRFPAETRTAEQAADALGCAVGAIVQSHPEVWAAAGAPYSVFALTPADLVRLSDGIVHDVAE